MDTNTPVTVSPRKYATAISNRRWRRYCVEHPYQSAAFYSIEMPLSGVTKAGALGYFAGYRVCRCLLVGSGLVIGGTIGLVVGMSRYWEGQPFGRTLREHSVAGMDMARTGCSQTLARCTGGVAGLGFACLATASLYYAAIPVLGVVGIMAAVLSLDFGINGVNQSVWVSVVEMLSHYTGSGYDVSHVTPAPPLNSLSEAIDYLRQQAGMENATSDMNSLNDQLGSLEEYDSRGLWQFLRQLVSTDEFNHSRATRGIVAAHILDVLSVSLNSPTLKEQAMIRIHDSLAGCRDHVLLALSDLQAAVFVYQIEEQIPAEMTPEEYLRGHARKLFFIDKIRNYSADFHSRQPLNRVGGHIEVENVFHISLAESYGLPVSIRRMASPGKRFVALVTEQDINELRDYLERAYVAEFDQFFECWSPWRKKQRKLSVTRYELLDQVPFQQDKSRCLIAREEADDLVYLNGFPYSYSKLKEWYIREGTDPLTRKPMCWCDVNRVQR